MVGRGAVRVGEPGDELSGELQQYRDKTRQGGHEVEESYLGYVFNKLTRKVDASLLIEINV